MQRYFCNQLKNNNFILNEDDWFHIKNVMRMKNNDLVEIVYNKELYIGKIDENNILLLNKEDIKLKHNKQYILCLPLLTDNKMSFILQKATELGINKIVPIITNRSVVKMNDEKIEKKYMRWYKICKEASEQSKRLDIPVISEIKKLKDLEFYGLKIIFSTRNKENTLKKVLSEKSENIVFLIGPEGGLEETEEQQLIDLGFIPTTLGNNVFRVETVPIYVLSILKYEE